MSFKITWKTHIVCMLITAVIAAVLFGQIDTTIQNCFLSGILRYPTGNIFLNFLLFIILLMIPVSLLHEAVHGAVYKIFGGRIIFGFNGIYAYCREITGITLSRSKFIAILLSPLVSISLLTWLVPHWIVSMVIILNALGSSGDILMFLYLCSKPRCRILDKEYGFDIIME
jgi:hypothetical protein